LGTAGANLVGTVFVIHYTRNPARKEYMQRQLQALNLTGRVVFVERHDREDLDPAKADSHYSHFRFLRNRSRFGGFGGFFPFELEPGDISVGLKVGNRCASRREGGGWGG
jgi:hypothetical protein